MRIAGDRRARQADRLGEDLRAAIGQIVAIDRGDDDVAEAEHLHRVRDPRRFGEIERDGLAVRHGAVAAGARADVAEDHERRRAVVPAFADVGAAGFFTDGVKVQAAHQLLELQVFLGAGRPHLQPVGFRHARGRAV